MCKAEARGNRLAEVWLEFRKVWKNYKTDCKTQFYQKKIKPKQNLIPDDQKLSHHRNQLIRTQLHNFFSKLRAITFCCLLDFNHSNNFKHFSNSKPLQCYDAFLNILDILFTVFIHSRLKITKHWKLKCTWNHDWYVLFYQLKSSF